MTPTIASPNLAFREETRATLLLHERSRLLALLLGGLLLSACDSGSSAKPPDGFTNITINEALASNGDIVDEDGESSDWLELYNPTDAPQNLAGWTLTDKEDQPAQWSLPDITLPAGEYLVVWASDKDRLEPELHTNFKISSSGETLFLFDDRGALASRLNVSSAPGGVSVSQTVAGTPIFYDTPTPGGVNSTHSFTGVVTGDVTFDHPGGENSTGPVGLSGAGANELIRYTLDATVPTESSPIYTAPIALDDATVIRARIFHDNHIPSATASRTFLLGETHDLPVITLVTDPPNFFDQDTGIYVFGDSFEDEEPFYGANFWENWEKEIHFAFYEADGTLGTELNGGVKIFGGWTRAMDQRSLSIFARGRYGAKEIKYPLFPDLPYDEFQGLVLRNSGNDWMHTMIRDPVLTSLMEGSGLDYQAYRPTAVYLNGDYWGLHNLREKTSEHFLASKHNLDADDINLLENGGDASEGTNTAYLELIDFVTNNDLSDPDNYAWVAEQIDIDNYVTYQMAQIYFNNDDWPGNNIKFWNSPTTKWRWILYGSEFGFGLYGEDRYVDNALNAATAPDGPAWPNPPWSTLLLRRLLENPDFVEQFINTFADAINSRFQPERVIARIDEYAAPIASEVTRHALRWLIFENEEEEELIPAYWAERLQVMKTFAERRPAYMKEHLRDFFELMDPVPVTVQLDEPSHGTVYLNSVQIDGASWTGDYFPGVAITLKAEAAAGYAFSHWSGDSESTEPTVVIDPATATMLQPVFVPSGI